MFEIIKKYDGFSCCFRQWRADGTHCKYLHGYGVSFELCFIGDLDSRNWVFDFGGMKRAKGKICDQNPSDWFKYMFDHTTIIAHDDPEFNRFIEMDGAGLIQLRVMPDVGAERFAEFIFKKVNQFLREETDGRVRLKWVRFMEHDKNSAVYGV